MKKGMVVVLTRDLFNIDPEGLQSYDVLIQEEVDKRLSKYASKNDKFVCIDNVDGPIFRGPKGQEVRLAEAWYYPTLETEKV